MEILSHEKGAVDLRWMKSGNAPLLYMHDSRQHVGAIETAKHNVEDRQCSSRARMAKDDEGDRHLQRCRDGIQRNTSVGYMTIIEEWERTDETRKTRTRCPPTAPRNGPRARPRLFPPRPTKPLASAACALSAFLTRKQFQIPSSSQLAPP